MRGTFIRLPLFTVRVASGGEGVRAQWTRNLVPIGEREVASGQSVELMVTVEASTRALTETSRVQFDIYDRDFLLTRADADRIGRMQGTGGVAPTGAAGSETRAVAFHRLADGETLAAFVASFVQANATESERPLLIVEEQTADAHRFHVLGWWTASRLPNRPNTSGFFVARLEDALEAQSDSFLTVSGATTAAVGGTIGLQLRLLYEDETPMADAEFEVEVGGKRIPGKTDGNGVAGVDVLVGAAETFRVFLLSFPERYIEPITPPEKPKARVVTHFALDSSFPGTAILDRLQRVVADSNRAPELRVMVIGHTDSQGSDAYNKTLSQRRAKAVLGLLSDNLAMFDEVANTEGWGMAAYQAMLRSLGCNPGAIDGGDGAMTREATSSFQREYNANVYHRQGRARAHPDLPVNGLQTPATRAAIRDSYVAIASHLPAERFTDPPLQGCGEANLISTKHEINRRAVVAFFEATTDLSAADFPCGANYANAVQEAGVGESGPWFTDFQWLRETSGAAHLSALTALPDGTSALFTVFRCEGPVPMSPPDSSSGQPRPIVGPELGKTQGAIRGGVAYARWTPPTGFDPFNSDDWLINYDFALEIFQPEEDAEPRADQIESGAGLLAAPGMNPPIFAIDAPEQWGFSGPPGQRLNRIRFADAGEVSGVAIRSDGGLVNFTTINGVIPAADHVDILALAVTERDVAFDADEV